MKPIFALLLATLLVGCGTPNIRSDYKLNAASGEGLVIGALTYDGALAKYNLEYKRMEDGKGNYFTVGSSMYPSFSRSDFSSYGYSGALFAASLPAGHYLMTKWGTGSGVVNSSATASDVVPFEVVAGKATYLGTFHFVPVRKISLTVGAKIVHTDKHERDLEVFRKLYPTLADVQIDSIDIRNGLLGEPSQNSITVTPVVPLLPIK